MKFEILTFNGQLFAEDELGTFYKLVPMKKEFASKICDTSTDPASPEQIITNLLIELHVPQDIKGFTFIQEAFCFLKEHPEASSNLLKIVYANIAKKYNSTISRVERAIRHAMSRAIIPEHYDYLRDTTPKAFLMACVKRF